MSLRRSGLRDSEGAFLPAVDVVEEKDNIIVKAELPGLTKEDVSVTLQDDSLMIKGEKKYEAESKEADFYRRERAHGAFSRLIELPAALDAQKIEAHFRDGLLHVTLPKTDPAKPKQTEVKVS